MSSRRANTFCRNIFFNTIPTLMSWKIWSRVIFTEDGDIEVIDMWEEGDGLQDNTFVKRKVSMVLMELLSDEHMAGRQHFGFKHTTDAKGVRVLGRPACESSWTSRLWGTRYSWKRFEGVHTPSNWPPPPLAQGGDHKRNIHILYDIISDIINHITSLEDTHCISY